MKTKPPSRVVGTIAALVFMICLSATVWAQDSGQDASLGDIARKARQNNQAKDRATPKHVISDENLGPHDKAYGTYVCRMLPCSTLTVMVPASAVNAGPTPTDGDHPHGVSMLSGTLLQSMNIQGAKQEFLGRSVVPFYHATLKIEFDETTTIDQWPATISHFTLTSRVMVYRGLALFVVVPNGSMAIACIFRDSESGNATGICDHAMNSARVNVPEQFRPHVEQPDPADDPPSADPPDDPVDEDQ
jgi:hypothetical protein